MKGPAVLDAILKKLAAYLVAELLSHSDELVDQLVTKLLPHIPTPEQIVDQLTDAIPGKWDDQLIDTLAAKLPKLIVDQLRAMLPGFLR